MKIKDVETKVGITKANIRFYEKEGLISPERNDENNYREYSMREVEQLERIKVLRVLGIPISDIRELQKGKLTLDTVMTRRLKTIQDEEKNLEAVRRVCENLKQSHLPYDAVSETILKEDDRSWSELLAKVLKEDITKEFLTPKQFNKNLALMLCWGYFLCAVVSFFFGNWMLSYAGDLSVSEKIAELPIPMEHSFPFAASYETLLFFPFMITIACYIIMYLTANMKILLLIFHISALNLSPIIASIYMFFHDSANVVLSGLHLAAFWLLIIIYVAALYLLSNTLKNFFQKVLHIIAAAVIYTAVMTLLMGALGWPRLITLIGFFLFTMFVGLNWFHAYQASPECNRYYAVTESCRIMNLFGTAFSMKGLTTPPFVQR